MKTGKNKKEEDELLLKHFNLLIQEFISSKKRKNFFHSTRQLIFQLGLQNMKDLRESHRLKKCIVLMSILLCYSITDLNKYFNMKIIDEYIPQIRTKMTTENNKNVIFIGRPSYWGNPFIMDDHNSRQNVICKYFQFIITPNLSIGPKILIELGQKTLICFIGYQLIPTVCESR